MRLEDGDGERGRKAYMSGWSRRRAVRKKLHMASSCIISASAVCFPIPR